MGIFLLSLLFFCVPIKAHADVLPYTLRTQSYNAYGTAVSGDIRTVGMASATVSVPLSMASSFDNPANLSLTLGGIGAHLSSNRFRDAAIQNENSSLNTTTVVAGVETYPWGFSLGYHVPWNEGQDYDTPSGLPIRTEIFAREFQASVSRVFLARKLSFGFGLRFGKGVKVIEYPTRAQLNTEHSGYTLGASMGMNYILPKRWIIGLVIHSAMVYPGEPALNTQEGVQNFFQPMVSPNRIGLGIGWVPNNYFQVGIAGHLFGPQTGTSLFSSETRTVGDSITFHPKIGATYRFIDYPEIDAQFSLGSYFEMSRISGVDSRPHITAGLQVNPWIFGLGWGVDFATGYQNNVLSFGLDFIKLFQKLDLVPKGTPPIRAGFLPPLTHFSDTGLPQGLAENWTPTGNPDFLDTVTTFPSRLRDKLEEITTDKPTPIQKKSIQKSP